MLEQEPAVTRQVIADDISAKVSPEFKAILLHTGYYEKTLGIMAEAELGGRDVTAGQAAVIAGAWIAVGKHLRDTYEGPLLSDSDVVLLGEMVQATGLVATA